MTQQYLAGELSVILGGVQAAATTSARASLAWELRREAETQPVSALPAVVARALALADSFCWESLAQGDIAAFTRQAGVAAELHDFGSCARLLRGD